MGSQTLVCLGLVGWLMLGVGCQRAAPVEAAKAVENKPPVVQIPVLKKGQVRATGTIQAVRVYTVQVPQIAGLPQGPQGRLTLVKLAPNGSRVQAGDILAEFDRTTQLDAGREAKAKHEDLSHQVRQKAAQNQSDQEKRAVELREAEAELARAQIQLRKGPILSEIDRLKNEERAKGAQARVTSLKIIDEHRRKAEAAALRILELQTERQKVALERAQRNLDRLVLKANIPGMVALENTWRGGSMGNAQEGDQMWPGQALLKIFDPTEMLVQTMVGEPDGAVLKEGVTATVYLDAYPDAVFQAKFAAASPVATAAMGSPIKNFTARFRLEKTDPRLLPDLSAAVVIGGEGGP